jgi:hypothetical protein
MFVMLCPSRGRPGAAGELIDAWTATTGRNADLRILVDEDDPARFDYPDVPAGWKNRITYHVVDNSPHSVAQIVNQAAKPLTNVYEGVGFLGDDHRPQTIGWDAVFAWRLAAGPAVVYGDDLHQREKLPTAVLMSSRVITGLRMFCPAGQNHLYLDDFWRMAGTELGCLFYEPSVIIEHRHPHAGKGQWDDGYARVNNPNLYEADKAAYDRFLRDQWPEVLRNAREWLAEDKAAAR